MTITEKNLLLALILCLGNNYSSKAACLPCFKKPEQACHKMHQLDERELIYRNACDGNLEKLKSLLAGKGNSFRVTAMQGAIENNHLPILHYLDALGADFGEGEKLFRSTAIHQASLHGNSEIIKFIAHHPTTRINCTDLCGYTPLYVAQKKESMQALLEARADVDQICTIFGEKGTVLMHFASSSSLSQKNEERINCLLEHGADCDTIKNDGGQSARDILEERYNWSQPVMTALQKRLSPSSHKQPADNASSKE